MGRALGQPKDNHSEDGDAERTVENKHPVLFRAVGRDIITHATGRIMRINNTVSQCSA
jgi:hypothetical protein